MITMFAIVVIATFVLAVTRAEGMRPLGLALVGMISLVFGAQATAIFTETSVAPLVNSMVFAQEGTAGTTESSSASSAADVPPPIESPALTPKSEDSTSQKAKTDEAKTDEAKTDETKTVEARTEEASASETTTTQPQPDEPVSGQSDAPAETGDPGSTGDINAAEAEEGESVTSPIKVEAITHVEYLDRDENAPSWLEVKPWSKGGVYFVPVVSRLQISESDSEAALAKEIKEVTDAYINRFLKNKHATTLLQLRAESTAPKVMGEFEEHVVVTAGTMHQSHALLSFDDDFRSEVQANWNEVRTTSRLMQTGLGAGIVLLLLSTMFSYFKLDTATRGYYTGRLQFAAAAAILAVIAASVLFANYVPWM